MTLASVVMDNQLFKIIPIKIYLDAIQQVKVKLGAPFEETWLVSHPKYYIPSPKVIDLLVLDKKILKGVYPIWALQPYHVYKFCSPTQNNLYMKFEFGGLMYL